MEAKSFNTCRLSGLHGVYKRLERTSEEVFYDLTLVCNSLDCREAHTDYDPDSNRATILVLRDTRVCEICRYWKPYIG